MTAQKIIEKLQLTEHPEGGYFRELYRNDKVVHDDQIAAERSAATHIYYLLKQGQLSRFHKVKNDELWHLYSGEGIRLHEFNETTKVYNTVELTKTDLNFMYAIKRGLWQAAEPIGDFVLVGCTVSPGFDFADWELIEPNSQIAKTMISNNKELTKFI